MTDAEYQRLYRLLEEALVTPEMRSHLAAVSAFGNEPEVERLRTQSLDLSAIARSTTAELEHHRAHLVEVTAERDQARRALRALARALRKAAEFNRCEARRWILSEYGARRAGAADALETVLRDFEPIEVGE